LIGGSIHEMRAMMVHPKAGSEPEHRSSIKGKVPESVSKITPLVYDELRRVARNYLRRERPGHSLQATALVNEAYLRLAKEGVRGWKNRSHFCAIAASSMREILVERARARKASKRGGSRIRVTLGDETAAVESKPVDLLNLDEALVRMEAFDPQLARIVELRFFGGLTVEDAAKTLKISPATVKRGWSLAKAWLRREMRKEAQVEI